MELDGFLSSRFNLDEALDRVGYGRYQRLLLIATAWTQLADAFELMLLPFLTYGVRCDKATNWHISDSKKTYLTLSVFLGMLIGAYVVGWVSDKFGRRPGYLLATSFCAVFGVASAFATSFWWLVAFRLLVGFGVGGAPAALTLYTEFIPRRNRGKHMIIFLAFFSLGTVCGAGLAWIIMPRMGWRWFLFLAAMPSVILLAVSIPLLPESPRYLILKGQKDDVLKLLQVMASVNRHNLSSPGRSSGYEDLEFTSAACAPNTDSVSTTHSTTSDWAVMQLFKGKLLRLTIVLAMLFFLMAVLYYGLVLLTVELQPSSAECSLADQDYLMIVISNAGEFPGLVVAYLLIEKIGRKDTITFNFIAVVVACGLLIIPTSQTVQTVLFFIARACALAFNQSLWIYTTEAFPTSVRALGVGFSTCFARVGGATSPFIATLLFDHSRNLSLGACAFIGLLAAAVSRSLPPDKKNAQLQETVDDTII